MNIVKTNEGTYHVYSGNPDNAMLYRYGILTKDTYMEPDGGCEETSEGIVLHTPLKDANFLCYQQAEGYQLQIPMDKGERIFGGGDANRNQLMIRGMKIDLVVDDFVSYGPMPIILSDKGWALFINSTYHIVLDCGKTNSDVLVIDVPKGSLDIYLFRADTIKGLLYRLTAVTGRPTMLPKFAYGLSFVENEQIDARGFLADVKSFRDRDIPCDIVGLEPAWMSKHYDYSLEKKWNPDTFYIPYWLEENTSSDFTFFYPMRMMGMNLSLWTCCDYDLLYAEDNDFKEVTQETKDKEGTIKDVHLAQGIKMDKITDKTTPWFEHLKKFVDNGAAGFKMDAANQVLHHRDRLWGGKYLDEEVHNVYCVLLAKQMNQGYKAYTGRRPFYYTAGAYAGTPQYAATWAGDTGGGENTVISLMTHAMCGHSNTTCDLEAADAHAIHYGFLTPWSQYFCWDSWKYPWFLGEEMEQLIRFYAKLRSSLVPYIYTMAHIAYESGISILRPLPLMYENTDRFDNVKNAYMFGDKFYVAVFDMNLKLPEGKWIDYWNGDVYEGDVQYQIPNGRGGALFVKEGSVFVTMKPQKYVLEKEHDYVINVYPGKDDQFSLYEDDGFTYDYQEGLYCTTDIRMQNTSQNGFELVVCQRKGRFDGRPDNGSDIRKNSIPEIKACGEVRDMEIRIFGKKPKSILLDGTNVDFDCVDHAVVFVMNASLHSVRDVVYQIEY